MRLMTRRIASGSGGGRLLEAHVSANAAVEPLLGEIGRTARDRGHRARVSGRLWRAQAFAWHTRGADGRRHRSFRFALLAGRQSRSSDARVYFARRAAL